MEKYKFKDILNLTEFNNLTTPEKIKLSLKKDIFEIVKSNPFDKSKVLLDYTVLDFSIFKDEEFKFCELYEVNNFVTHLNHSIVEEIFGEICLNVRNSLISLNFFSEIKFKVEIFNSQDEKLNFLSQEIIKINPLNLNDIDVYFDWTTNELILSPDLPMELVCKNPNIILDWITGNIKYKANFETYQGIKKFCESYQKLILAQYCYKELQSLKSSFEEEKDDDPKKFNAYQQAYFLNEIGIIKKMRSSLITEKEIAVIVSKIINRSYDNARSNIREFNTTSIDNISTQKQKARKEIDDLIKSFTNLG